MHLLILSICKGSPTSWRFLFDARDYNFHGFICVINPCSWLEELEKSLWEISENSMIQLYQLWTNEWAYFTFQLQKYFASDKSQNVLHSMDGQPPDHLKGIIKDEKSSNTISSRENDVVNWIELKVSCLEHIKLPLLVVLDSNAFKLECSLTLLWSDISNYSIRD